MDQELAAIAAQLGLDTPEKLKALQALVDWILREVRQQLILRR